MDASRQQKKKCSSLQLIHYQRFIISRLRFRPRIKGVFRDNKTKCRSKALVLRDSTAARIQDRRRESSISLAERKSASTGSTDCLWTRLVSLRHKQRAFQQAGSDFYAAA